jgi:hypothetical protein
MGRGRRGLLGAVALVAATVTVGITGAPGASAAGTVLAPTALTIEAGASSGGLSDVQAADGSSLRLGPLVSRSYRTYAVPPSFELASLWSFTVRSTVSSPVRTQQRWTWFVRDFVAKKWVKLGDNIEIDSAAPRTLRFYPEGPWSSFISSSRAIQVRSVSNKKPLSLLLDAESVELENGPLPTFGGWTPPVGSRWQYQLQPPVDTAITATAWSTGATVRPDVFDIDLFEADGVTPANATVAAIHARGAKAICYVDAGTWENWRPDAGSFPTSVRGATNGWPGERWLDIRRLDVLVPIMDARVGRCAAAGFDAVEFDNMDAAFNRSGFPVSPAQQIEFNRAMAAIAHDHGLAVGLKNDVGQLTQLLPYFDFAINEQCQQYGECGGYGAWTAAGKAVAQVEYTIGLATFCPPATAGHRSAIRKALALQATPYTPCN